MIKGIFEKGKAKMLSISLGVMCGVLALGSQAFAAVDPDVASTSAMVGTRVRSGIETFLNPIFLSAIILY